MVTNLFLSFFLVVINNYGDSIKDFQKELDRNIERNIGLPPESDSGDTCYHYSELLKVEIDKFYKVKSIELSDSAPQWLKADLSKQMKKKSFNFKKLDSLAYAGKLRNCILVFPLVIESDDFPCGFERKKRKTNEKFFQFGGMNLKGNITFGEEIRCIIPIAYKTKEN